MTSVSRAGVNPLGGPGPLADIPEIGPTTGSGLQNQHGPVPDANNTGLILGLTAALQSFAPANLGSDFETRLAEVTDKLKATTTEAEKNRVNNEMETKRINIEENQARMKEAQDKMDEAEAKAKSGNIWDKIALAFQFLGAIIMAALGAVLIATGVGTAAGALMVAGAALMLLSAVNSVVAQTSEDGLGIAGSIAKAAGADMETAGKADMGFGISLAIVTAIVAIAATVVTGGAAGSALVSTIQNVLNVGSQIANAGSATAGAVSAGINADAAVIRKEATEIQAKGKEQEAFMQQLDDLIDQALTMLMAANDRFNAIMDSVTEMVQDTGNTLSNTRFAG